MLKGHLAPVNASRSYAIPLSFDFKAAHATFFDDLVAVIDSLTRNQQLTVQYRIGLDSEPITLEQIGNRTATTRQNSQSLEARALKRIQRRSPDFALTVNRRVLRALRGRMTPLSTQLLQNEDPYFERVFEKPWVLSYVLNNMLSATEGLRSFMLDINDEYYLATVSQHEWEASVKSGQRLLKNAITQKLDLSQAEAYSQVQALFSELDPQMRPLYWEVVSAHATFATDANGNAVLVGFGLSGDGLVSQILRELERPRTIADIYQRFCILAEQKRRKRLSLSSVHNLLRQCGLLYGHGVYGGLHHLPFSEQTCAAIIAAADRIVTSDTSRQWHAAELSEMINEQQIPMEVKLDPYLLSIVLNASEAVSSLKRMIWVARANGLQGASDRHNIKQMVVEIIQENGGAMSTREIRRAMLQHRGLSYYFQIFPDDLIVSLGDAMWDVIG